MEDNLKFTIRKKGKTVGRPSKTEKIVGELINYYYKKHEEEISQALKKYILDLAMYGKAEFTWSPKKIDE